MSEAAEKRIDELERELVGVQQMLYHVLNEIGEPVVVTKETLREGIRGDKMISVVDNEEEGAFIFSLIDIVEEQ